MGKNTKKRIGIVSIQSFNLGNRLQNFALQRTLEKMGYEVNTIRREDYSNNHISLMKRLAQNVLGSKGAKFRGFDRKIHMSPFLASANTIPAQAKDAYDFFVAGSDQIWNPSYDFTGDVDFLRFADKQQRIAYAASFGVTEIPDECKEKYKKYLMGFKAVSFREASGAKVYKELTGRDACIVLDPTMLLSASEWRSIERKPAISASDYVLVYALGDKTNDFQRKIDELALSHKVIDVGKKMRNGHEQPIGPSEFLYLVDHASIVLTNSFHGTVFSILFNRQFISFTRGDVRDDTRISDLLDAFDLQREGQNYTNTGVILQRLREQSIDFIMTSLTN